MYQNTADINVSIRRIIVNMLNLFDFKELNAKDYLHSERTFKKI